MLKGYARVSSVEQQTTLQLDALRTAGVRHIVEEKRSSLQVRPALERLLDGLEPGDVVLVYKVDRVARSLADLLRILARIDEAGARFRSLTEPIDTTTPAGRMLVHLLGAFAEFERSMIRERAMAGQEAAYLRGVRFGRRRALSDNQVAACHERWVKGGVTRTELAAEHGVDLTTMSRALKRFEDPSFSAVPSRMRQRVAKRRSKN